MAQLQFLDLTGLTTYHTELTKVLDDMKEEYRSIIWVGTKAEYDAAIEEHGEEWFKYKTVFITDEDSVVVEEISNSDINNLFNAN